MITSKPAISISDCAYYGGLIDGEGYFYICPDHSNSNVYMRSGLKIAMVDKDNILDRAKTLWGGWGKSKKARSVRHRATEEWVIEGKNLDKLIVDLLPYLRGKRQQAELIQEFRHFVSHSHFLTKAVNDYRTHLMEGLKGLHHSIPFEINNDLKEKAMADVHTKRFVSAETIKKLSESHKGKHHAGTFKKGQPSWSAGKKFTEEHKRKIGEANKIALKRYYETNEAWNKKPLV